MDWSIVVWQGELVSGVAVCADSRLIERQLRRAGRYRSRAAVAFAAQAVYIPSGKQLVRFDFVVLIAHMVDTWAMAVDAAYFAHLVVFAALVCGLDVNVALEAPGHGIAFCRTRLVGIISGHVDVVESERLELFRAEAVRLFGPGGGGRVCLARSRLPVIPVLASDHTNGP